MDCGRAGEHTGPMTSRREAIGLTRRVNTDTELVLEISGRRPDGRQVQMRLVLEKQ